MNTSTGAFFFKGIAARMPPLLGLEVFALEIRGQGVGEARSSRFSGEERLGLACTFDTGDMAGLDVKGVDLRSGGDVAEFDTGGVDATLLGVVLMTLDGLVNALSLFSLSSFVMGPGLVVSLCSTRFLLGAKITAGLTEGSMAVGVAAFRCSSISMRGAVVIVLLVVAGLNLMSIGAKIPGRRAGFWKWPIALASFRNWFSFPFLLTQALASPSFLRVLSPGGGFVPLS